MSPSAVHVAEESAFRAVDEVPRYVDRSVDKGGTSSGVGGVLDLDIDTDVTPLSCDCNTNFGVNERAVGRDPESHFEPIGIPGFG